MIRAPLPPREPGPILAWLGRKLLSNTKTTGRPVATDADYFAWEVASAEGAWEYYSRFLPGDCEQRLRILDVGSGPGGRTASHATESKAFFFSVDRNVEFQASAARNIRSKSIERIVPVVGNAYSLPFPDESFDACLCENALEHFDQPGQAIREMLRVLKTGGHILALLPPWRGPYAGHLSRLTWLPWIHLLPRPIFIGLLAAIHFARDREPGGWEGTTAATVANLDRSLNRWSISEVLSAFRESDILDLTAAYVLGQWKAGRVLRFVPWLGEFFSSAVYLVFRKCDRRSRTARTFNDLLRLTLMRRHGAPLQP